MHVFQVFPFYDMTTSLCITITSPNLLFFFWPFLLAKFWENFWVLLYTNLGKKEIQDSQMPLRCLIKCPKWSLKLNVMNFCWIFARGEELQPVRRWPEPVKWERFDRFLDLGFSFCYTVTPASPTLARVRELTGEVKWEIWQIFGFGFFILLLLFFLFYVNFSVCLCVFWVRAKPRQVQCSLEMMISSFWLFPLKNKHCNSNGVRRSVRRR